ncbi:MAG: MgtC/SapB family protein [Xenococcaceae cyanobacterium]
MPNLSSFSLDDWLAIALKMFLALLIGGLIGWNRQKEGKPAGLRTHMLVSLGSALFVMIPIYLNRIANINNSEILSRGIQGSIQGVATGIGFLGAGEILRQPSRGNGRDRIYGLTSAAAIWVSSALGVAVGTGLYPIAILGVIFSWIVLKIIKQFEV